MRMLVACEFSGTVRDAFAARGHDAWSCDILPTESPGQHFMGDVMNVLWWGWDLIIAHPPCTYLTNAGVRHLHSIPTCTGKLPVVHGEARKRAMIKAAHFFRALLNAPAKRIAVENPIPHCYAREIIGPYSQLIQPWMFGHGETKATCLWLRGLPPLQRTHRGEGDFFCKPEPLGRVQRLHLLSPGPNRWKERSKTFQGIADAMADQWG